MVKIIILIFNSIKYKHKNKNKLNFKNNNKNNKLWDKNNKDKDQGIKSMSLSKIK